MKKFMSVALCLASAAVLVGCASIQTAEKFNDQKIAPTEANVTHINGDNWGFYVLWIPIFSGSTEKIGTMEFLGSDSVKVGPVVDMVTKKSKEMGATKTLDIVSSVNSMWFFPVFFIKDVQVSGNAVK